MTREQDRMAANLNAWIAIDHGLGVDCRLAPYTLVLKGDRSLYRSIAKDDWVLVLDAAGAVVRAGGVLPIRSDLDDLLPHCWQAR